MQRRGYGSNMVDVDAVDICRIREYYVLLDWLYAQI